MADRMTGGCQCGRIRYVAEIDSDDAYLCHCRMCQRATGGVSIAFRNVPKAAVTWEQEPDRYRSSPFAQRGFCSNCGTPLTFEFDEGKNVDLTVGSFDDPRRFKPTSHFGKESWHEAWLDTSMLPAKRSDEHQPLGRQMDEQRWQIPRLSRNISIVSTVSAWPGARLEMGGRSS